MARSRPNLQALPPAVLGMGAVVVVLSIIAIATIVSSSGARSELARTEADLKTAEARAETLTTDNGTLRQQLQTRAGELADLQDRVTDLESELADARLGADQAAQSAEQAEEASEEASQAAAAAESISQITSVLASTPQTTRVMHVTEVTDGNVLVGFDLREMLSDSANAGQTLQVRLLLTDAPGPGDCRHTQSSSLAKAWLESTDYDIVLRQPAGAPRTDEQGRELAEVLAFVNPTSSLNVTLVVAGEAVIDEDDVDDDPDLTERLRVAQASAAQAVLGVWGCSQSDLLEGDDPTPTESPSAGETPADGEATPPANPTPADS